MNKQNIICKCGHFCNHNFTPKQIREFYSEYLNSDTLQKQRKYLLNLIKVNDLNTYWLKVRNGALKRVCRRMFRYTFQLTRKQIQRLNMESIFYKRQKEDVNSNETSITSESEEETQIQPKETSKIIEPTRATRGRTHVRRQLTAKTMKVEANATEDKTKATLIDLTGEPPKAPVAAAPGTPRTSKLGRLHLKRGTKCPAEMIAAKASKEPLETPARVEGHQSTSQKHSTTSESLTATTSTAERSTAIRNAKLRAAAAISAAAVATRASASNLRFKLQRGVKTSRDFKGTDATTAGHHSTTQQQSTARNPLSPASRNKMRNVIINAIESASASVVAAATATNDLSTFDAIAAAAMQASSIFANIAASAAATVALSESDNNNAVAAATTASANMYRQISIRSATAHADAVVTAASAMCITGAMFPNAGGMFRPRL